MVDSVLVLQAVAQVATVSIPDVQPDFSAPFFVGLQQLVSWFLAVAALVSIVALAYCLKRPGFRGGSVIGNRLRREPVLQRS